MVEAFLKTPQRGGPLHSLAGFERVHLEAGESHPVTLTLSPRSLSSVDDQGTRSILNGTYRLILSSAQPKDAEAKSEASFTIDGMVQLLK